jgi:hypothetical protein
MTTTAAGARSADASVLVLVLHGASLVLGIWLTASATKMMILSMAAQQ